MNSRYQAGASVCCWGAWGAWSSQLLLFSLRGTRGRGRAVTPWPAALSSFCHLA